MANAWIGLSYAVLSVQALEPAPIGWAWSGLLRELKGGAQCRHAEGRDCCTRSMDRSAQWLRLVGQAGSCVKELGG